MTPVRSTLKDVQNLIITRHDWVKQQLASYAQMQSTKGDAYGQKTWMFGESLAIDSVLAFENSIIQTTNSVQIKARQLLSKEQISRRVRNWQKTQAKQYLQARHQEIETRTNMVSESCLVKQFSARWGSCQSDGVIKLNWRLIMVPHDVIDYVIIHELCHLSHFNHSQQFWSLVELHCPEFKQHRLWLKQQGSLLMVL